MIERIVKKQLMNRMATYPAVALVGPRQSGKTTLARSLGGEYFDLEQPQDRLRLDLAWDQLIGKQQLVVLDEAQSSPDVFKRLRGAIDADRSRNGRFLLLGSVSPALMSQVSESLAGRLSLLELSPLLSIELPADLRENLWLYGGFPDGGILSPTRFPQWQKDYLSLLAQRDLPQWGLPARPQVIDRFLRMLAAFHGQTWNASQIGQSMGLDHKTVNNYLEYLIGAFLVRQLQPFHRNIRKRLVKSSKMYWRDSGLVHALLNVSDLQSLTVQPWVGASWEGFVIGQILDALQAAGKSADAYYFRTSDQHELDLVLNRGKEIWAMEIKLSSQPGADDMTRLNKSGDLIGATRRFLISRVQQVIDNGKSASCNLEWMLAFLLA